VSRWGAACCTGTTQFQGSEPLACARARVGRERLRRQHHVQVPGSDIGDRVVGRLQRRQQAATAELGEGGAAAQDDRVVPGIGHRQGST
jgi:hypothetical protein